MISRSDKMFSVCFPFCGLKYVTLARLLVCFVCLSLSFPSSALSPRVRLARTLNLIEKGDFLKGSKELYRLSRKKAFRNKRVQLKYTLGIAFMEMRLYHMASLQFIYVTKSGNRHYRSKAVEKLIKLAEFLGTSDFIYYVLTKVQIRDFPAAQKDKLYFYFGLLEFKKKRYSRSRFYFSRVKSGTEFYHKALYQIALSHAEQGRPLKASRIFRQLAGTRSGITDKIRVAAIMGEARSLYQAKKFAAALKVYRSVPRDTKYWHEVLLESSWAYLRSAKFRSALSNFQTLHSSFYEGYYQPESLILRSYVYLYICRYYEMEKVLDLFKAVYIPTLKSVKRHLSSKSDFIFQLERSLQNGSEHTGSSSSLPSVVIKRLVRHSELQAAWNSLLKLREEKNRLSTMPHHWVASQVGRNTNAVIRARMDTMKKRMEKLARFVLLEVKEELERLDTLEQYLRYDMLRGKRESVKKRIRRKYSDAFQIDEKLDRDYYIKNGYEYWPFKGENWLDELGNYHYIGLQNCE